ncbi:MAG: glycosyltransferase family 2 protein [Planctomycetota bacterium]|nr:glycosyltransferase family 2 protein [Planctomycetota bacterium]MDP6763690.1 glycosyltransferase family 2 protein [Planctomycetota bacterium]MDP6989477.1 glycosyltransferase family 2 protein [Planctomycetota bacterium]
MSSSIDLSIVVPVFDEEQNLPVLHTELVAALEPTGRTWEVLYVDDRSTDRSRARLLELWRGDPHVRVVCFRARAGQTAALAAGFAQSRGRVVVTIDGDLQNDPGDIPALLDRLDEGCDIVAGWRRERHDGVLLRTLPSKLANRLIAWVTGVAIHDTGCTLKAFRRELVEQLPIYAEQHRFLPAMSAGSGARVGEVVVGHRPRRFGRSKYGLARAWGVLADLLTVKMIASFSRSPLQYFLLLAAPFAAAAGGIAYAGWSRGAGVLEDGVASGVMLGACALCASAWAYFFLLGLLAELVVKASDVHLAGRGRRILATSSHG